MPDNAMLAYEERIVAFVDVLGFSALTLASRDDGTALTKLSALVAANRIFADFYKKMLEFGTATFFSDSFVVSMAPEQAWYLFRHTGQLCRYLLLQGLPCRGAIALGPLYHRENVIVGPALVEAYDAERKRACMPRVILDAGALALWQHEFREGCAFAELNGLLKQDGDQPYLDIFHPRWADSFVAWPDGVPADHDAYRDTALRVIADGQKMVTADDSVRRKYDWLAQECAKHPAA